LTDGKRQPPRMRDESSRDTSAPGASPGGTPSRRLDGVVVLARAVLLWERLWRALLILLLLIGLFFCLSFAGLWLEVGRGSRMCGVAFFVAALLLSLIPLLRLALPSRKEALARIDRRSGLAHRPASTLEDRLANASEDPATLALWALHQRRIRQNIAELRVGAPSPRLADFDRYALRAAVLFALVACAFLAGPEKYARVAAAFDWQGGDARASGFRLDAWIDPPPYTGRAPVLLNVASAARMPEGPVKIETPVNSTVIIRSAGDTVSVETQGALAPVKDDKPATQTSAKTTSTPSTRTEAAAGANEQKLTLQGDARLALRRGGAVIGKFELSAIPDKPPRIQLTDAPHANARGSLTLAYKIEDDYGVTGAGAEFRDPSVEAEALQKSPRSLVPPPLLSLNLAPGTGGLGTTETTGDLSDHPWAGARATMVLTARDEGGNEGKSDPIELFLPQKSFTKPLARALVEQRRDLVLFPDDHGRVLIALEALMIAPESFGTTAGIYLGLDVAANMLRKAHSDPELLAAADYLWAMALEIENGDLSDAERELRAAEQKLRDALQHNAPDEEIAKLTEELRSAMDKFLKEFAEKQMRDQNGRDQADRSMDRGRTISEKDLQAMLKHLEDMARSGDRADAQKMLEQLQNLLENLRTAQRRQVDPSRRQMSQALDELNRMMRDQQDLRDETHQQGQQAQEEDPSFGQRRRGSPRQQQRQDRRENSQRSPNSQGQAGDQSLEKRQEALRDRLQQLQKRMQQGGHQQPGLGDAEQAMRDAEKALGEGDEGRQGAEDAQGRALEAMRRGAENLAQQMQQGDGQPGSQVGEDEGEQGASDRAEGSEDTDPLGRPMSADPLNPRARFDPMGVPAAQRAQRVLEELRKRLADPSRPREEMDYLERLLKRY
jgi:uncharacterized protein (TIGR02302 family)